MQDLSLGNQLGQGANGVLDRGVRVDPVLVVKVDAVGAQPLQGAFDAIRMFAGLLSSTPGPPPACET